MTTPLQSLDADLQEVHRLVNLTKSALVRDRLHGLLSELLQARPRITSLHVILWRSQRCPEPFASSPPLCRAQ